MQLSNKLNLGDTVRFGWDDGFDTGKVIQVYKDGSVDVFRPYVHTANFSCAGSEDGASSVMAYIGFETVKRIPPEKLILLRRGGPVR